MAIASINEQLLRAVGVGIALFDGKTGNLQFCNDVFGEWFDDAGPGVSIQTLFPELDLAELKASIDAGGRHSGELSFRRNRRTLVLAQIISQATVGDESVYVMECQNITRIRELESMLASYSKMVERNTREIQKEKDQVEELLLNILPRGAYDEYKSFGVITPKRYEDASVLVLDFVGFTKMSEQLAPANLVSELNELYTAFDQIGEQLGCERIKTNGDTYFCIAGLEESDLDHRASIIKTASLYRQFLKKRNQNSEVDWVCRIGLGSGAVIGSVVGVKKYVFDVFGPAVSDAVAANTVAGDFEIIATDAFAAEGPHATQFAPSIPGMQVLIAD